MEMQMRRLVVDAKTVNMLSLQTFANQRGTVTNQTPESARLFLVHF